MNHMSAHHHDPGIDRPSVDSVNRTGARLKVAFDIGTCEFTAAADALNVIVQAPDPANLFRLQELIAFRIETIGHRDHLAVLWHPPDLPAIHSSRS